MSLVATPNTNGTVDYTIAVTNISASSVTGVVVQYRVPAELSFNDTLAVDPDPSGCATVVDAAVCDPREEAAWGLGTLASGVTQEINITATVAGGLDSGTLIYVPVRVTAAQLIDDINIYSTLVVQP